MQKSERNEQRPSKAIGTVIFSQSERQFTTPSWQVVNIEATVKDFMAGGILFEHFEGFSPDALNLCAFPNGSKVAIVKDPVGNTSSATQH